MLKKLIFLILLLGLVVLNTANANTSTRKDGDFQQLKIEQLQKHLILARNHSYYGQKSYRTGRPKTVPVRPYFKKNGTYVPKHYRSTPRRKR